MVAILEDDPGRIGAMRAVLIRLFPAADVIFFDHAATMIDWLRDHLACVDLISLDHDLPIHDAAGEPQDFGTGREVADFLAGLLPTCPIIVHSSNHNFAPGMFFALKDSGWPCSRVYPCDDLLWVGQAWVDQIKQYVSSGWLTL